MLISQFTDNDRVKKVMQDLITHDVYKKRFSDVTDDKGHQYVDLVMEGGGVLGVALVGYTWLLEHVGIRFAGIAGTSAGAINAMMMAALGELDDAKSLNTLSAVASKNFYDFVDGPTRSKSLIKSILDGKGVVKIGWSAFRAKKHIKKHLGLNPGHAFEDWMRDILNHNGVKTTKDLLDKRNPANNPMKLHEEALSKDKNFKNKLAFITTDISTQTKVDFPRMSALYWANIDDVDPAYYVRASMSIPVFFEPFRVDVQCQNKKAWDDMANYDGPVPDEAVFVDGGLVSNFPIHIFHSKTASIPRKPTFGAKLGVERNNFKKIDSLKSLGGASFDTARHLFDYDYILRNRDFEKIIAIIDTKDHNWLNFEMTDAEKVDLFCLGVEKAAEFLIGFDWLEYRKLRMEAADPIKESPLLNVN